MTYSYDLRVKALDYLEKDDNKVEASRIFGVTIRTLFNWVKRKKQGCLACTNKRKRKPYKIDGKKLQAYIENHPDSYLRELAEIFGTSTTAIFKACKKLKITLKKRRPFTRRGIRTKEKIFKKS
jgi:transposase